jgi:hypothetical protein
MSLMIFFWMKKMNDLNKMDELSNEHWQQIKLQFSPSIIIFLLSILEVTFIPFYYLVESFLPLPCLCIYSTLTALYATNSHGHLTIVFLFNST